MSGVGFTYIGAHSLEDWICPTATVGVLLQHIRPWELQWWLNEALAGIAFWVYRKMNRTECSVHSFMASAQAGFKHMDLRELLNMFAIQLHAVFFFANWLGNQKK